MRIIVGDTNTKEFLGTVGLHKGSTLSPDLFILVMVELTHTIKDEVPWWMLFADDSVNQQNQRERRPKA